MQTKIIPSLILLVTSLSFTGLTGCQNSQEMKAPPVEPPKRIDVTYVCERGLGEIGMRFFPDHGVAVLVLVGKLMNYSNKLVHLVLGIAMQNIVFVVKVGKLG